MEINREMLEDMRKLVEYKHERCAYMEEKLDEAVRELKEKDAIIKKFESECVCSAKCNRNDPNASTYEKMLTMSEMELAELLLRVYHRACFDAQERIFAEDRARLCSSIEDTERYFRETFMKIKAENNPFIIAAIDRANGNVFKEE